MVNERDNQASVVVRDLGGRESGDQIRRDPLSANRFEKGLSEDHIGRWIDGRRARRGREDRQLGRERTQPLQPVNGRQLTFIGLSYANTMFYRHTQLKEQSVRCLDRGWVELGLTQGGE